MTRHTPPTILLAGMLLVAMHASPARAAEVLHTWVASTGLDTNECTRAAPCQTFSGAFLRTRDGGHITCADSGHYGGLTINKSLTINCEASIAANTFSDSLGSFFVTTSSSHFVTLRGLYLDNGNVAASVIDFTGAGTLHIENTKMANTSGAVPGVNFRPSGTARLHISNSSVSHSGSSGIAAGIHIKPASGVTASVTIERTLVENNLYGIIVDGTGGGTIRGIVSDSVVSGNINNGITVASSGPNVVLAIDNVQVANNGFGLVASGTNAGMLVSRSFITANATGLFTLSGGVILSYRDNRLNNNTTTDGVFTGPVGLQ